MFNVSVIPGRELPQPQWDRWVQLQRANPVLDSPYFRPEFCRIVAAIRNDVHVAQIEQSGRTVGFFPFQRSLWGKGFPVGGRLNDFQGIVADTGLSISPEALLRGCGLRSWEFHHLLSCQQTFAPHHWETGDSPYLDLSHGFEAYVKSRKEDTEELSKLPRKIRKMAKEMGELRFELQCDDRQVFDTLIEWKSEQYRRTGLTDVFAFPWTVRLLEEIWSSRTEAFEGLLSVLYSGDRIAAIHFGMRSFGVLHSWFPAYCHDFQKYSPGLALMYFLAEHGATAGIRRIDLGRGDEHYKVSLRSGGTNVSEGTVARSSLGGQVHRAAHELRSWIRQSSLYTLARRPLNMVRPLREWMAFR